MPVFQLHKVLFSLLLLFVANAHANAQTEYFVEINTSNGTFKKMNSLPFVKWINPLCTAYDPIKHRYYFCGSADDMQMYLYTIDALEGKVLDSAAFLRFNEPNSNVLNLQFCPKNDMLYAVHWDDNLKKEFFITIDTHSGAINIINEIPEIKYVGIFSMLDEARNEYIFQVYDTATGLSLCFLDINTGTVVKRESTSQQLNKFIYNPTEDKIYAIYSTSDSIDKQLCVLNRNTLLIEASYPLPGIYNHYIGSANYAYNAKENIFTMVTADTIENSDVLTNINTKTGQVINSSPFPYVNNVGENVICFAYDPVWNKLFGVHWEPVTDRSFENDKLIVYPNPFTDVVNFEFRNKYKEINIFLYDITYKYIGRQIFTNTNKAEVKRISMASGIYYAKVVINNIYFDSVKIHAK